MSVGILGTKVGMTQIFEAESGKAIPVTVIQAGPCIVTQIKTKQTDGYTAIQLGYGEVPDNKRKLNTKKTPDKEVNKYLSNAEQGHLAKSGGTCVRHLKEYRVSEPESFQLGQQLKADIFTQGQLVDVSGTSMGRGFSGYQKRHNFKRGPMAHGSKNHRQPGSIGPGTTPGRVYPGKRMAGHYGASQVTTRKLIVVRIDPERNLLLVKGAVPGKPGGLLSIAPANIVGGK
ncbi:MULTISPECIES: 50S ribosomal protein L3 [Planktothrix]|uniref:Large ribosomal subunit protein uL3 n=4 Tax=Planktothrix TaxID=54304 RepID=A0A073CD97_PLAA1|nr:MULTISPECIES: 50S ribosomal protein L3 [Planktothrix]MCB8780677.1 50S ribosomal protein L3 [Planktothrix agardhii 1808]MCF3608419.1 50S ribosomal protein L3 [Planktothrix agardhii 1033]CAD5921264.1 50S ribosomal protein L3 [Planktothrix rubescens]BBD54543.1 50S ribosomal protein L3 [Planktothrix agardhii NIES-204]KEI65628.1 RplC [Planktothrix agardhii NIVA-CYA 126/8]